MRASTLGKRIPQLFGKSRRRRTTDLRRRLYRHPHTQPLEERTMLATVNVTTNANSGAGSLRDAIAIASGNTEDTVINIPADTYMLTEMDVVGSGYKITLQGAGSGSTIIDGQGSSRLFDLSSNADVEFNGITIRNGQDSKGSGVYAFVATASFDDVVLENHTSSNYGGAVYAKNSTLSFSNSIIQQNVGYYGAGVYAESTPTTFTNTQILDNDATRFGGGIYQTGSDITVIDSVIDGNDATGYSGGGIYAKNLSSATLTRSVVNDNQSYYGGGVYFLDGDVLIEDSTISNNYGDYSGGGAVIYNSSTAVINGSTFSGNRSEVGGDGGGLWARGSYHLYVTNSTFSNNYALDYGGGIRRLYGPSTLTNVTVAGNTADTGGGGFESIWSYPTYGVNTIFADNSAPSAPDFIGTLHSNGNNLVESPTFGVGNNYHQGNTASDLLNVDPALGLLQDNGGYTFTQAPGPGSPVIDAGTSTGVFNALSLPLLLR